MDNRIKVIGIFFVSIFVACIATCAAFFLPDVAESDIMAFATGNFVEIKSMKGNYFVGINENGINPTIETSDYKTGRYASNVTVTFNVETEYYRIDYSFGGNRIEGSISKTPEEGVVFKADRSGRYELTCLAYDSETDDTPKGSETVEFLNDADSPRLAENKSFTEEMSVWKRPGQEYVTTVDWGAFVDDLSGIGAIIYRFLYGDNTYSDPYEVELTTAGKSELAVNKKCTLLVVCVDKAGNSSEKRYDFYGFDDVTPPDPIYEITPTPREGVYAQEYEIKVNFLPDNGGSGLKEKQAYSINGETVYFEGKPPIPEVIKLDKPTDYTVILYATDNAGNVSRGVEIKIPYYAFDVTPPDVSGADRQIDLSDKNGFCRITINANDRGESGIAQVVSQDGKIVFTQGASGEKELYFAKFDCYGFDGELVAVLTDNVGNKTRYPIAIPYFNDVEISTSVQKCVEKLRKTDITKYADVTQSKIKSALKNVNNLLCLNNSVRTEILNAVAKLMETLEQTVSVAYEITSAPEYASANVVLSLNDSDFSSYPIGSEVSVFLSKREADYKNYIEIANFDQGFTDFFSFSVKINGESLVEPLKEGIYVGMNKPVAYNDREVAVIDVNTGKVVATEIKNNRIFFTIKGDGDYALVVSGGKAIASDGKEIKSIKVFGREMKLSVFLGIVCGTFGGCFMIVATLLIIMKARR